MSKNTSVSLGDHFEEFIALKIKSGRFGSASEIVRAGLRLLEDNELKLELLRKELDKGESSGFGEYEYNSFVAELDKPYS
jgi:antitoxin ParD1/3/4